MNDQTAQLLNQLAQKLGVTTTYLWAVLVKEARIEAISETVWVLFAIGLVVGIVRYWKWVKTLDRYDTDSPFVFGFIVSVVIFFFVIITLCNTGDIPTQLLNPQYWALEQVLQAIKH